MSQRVDYFVGWQGVVANEPLLAELQAPSNYKDEVKKKAYVEEKRAQRLAELPLWPIISRPDHIVVINIAGSVAFEERGGFAAIRFVEFVATQSPELQKMPLDKLADETQITARFFGLNVKLLFRSAAMRALELGAKVPPRLWIGTPGVYDPYDLLVPADMRSSLDLLSLLLFFGANEFLETVDLSTAEPPAPFSLARIARELALRAQLGADP